MAIRTIEEQDIYLAVAVMERLRHEWTGSDRMAGKALTFDYEEGKLMAEYRLVWIMIGHMFGVCKDGNVIGCIVCESDRNLKDEIDKVLNPHGRRYVSHDSTGLMITEVTKEP